MGKRKPKIFIGINEIGDYTLNLSLGFRELGYEVTNAVLEPDSPVLEFRAKHDRYIKRGTNKGTLLLYRLLEFTRTALCHDIFIFIFSESFFPSSLLLAKSRIARWLAYRDLPILKAMGKKIVIVTNGSDVRHFSETEKQASEDGYKYHVCLNCAYRETCFLSLKKEKVGIIERYADYIYSTPLIGHLFKRPYINFKLPVVLSRTRYAFTVTPDPLILHAPTDRSIKGTKYIIEAVERLGKEGYRFRFLLCENMKNTEVMKKLEESEIVVDQLLARGHGLFALEAIARGNVVLNHATPGRYGSPPDQPFIITTPDTVYDNLKMVLENPGFRVKKAQEGRAYVEKYHDHVDVSRKFLTDIGELPG